MKPELEKLCTEFIANRDAVQKAFRWDNGAVYSLCANIFCACGRTADAERLKACRKIIEAQTGHFSKFRKKTRSILCCMLSLVDEPENRMALANDYYRMLKQEFRDTEYLALCAFLLADLEEDGRMPERIARGKELFVRMDKEHPILTNDTDSVFALALAFSDRSDDELLADLEACYRALKTSFSGGDAQTAAQILTVAAGAPEEKAQRVTDLYNALKAADVSYGRSSELAPLAALSLADVPIPVLVEEIREADEFLKGKKGYEGKKDEDEKKRAMHALMIVSDQYAGTSQVNITVMTNTLDILYAQESAARLSLAFHLVEGAAQLLGGLSKSSEKTEGETAGQPDAEKQPEK